MNCILGIQKIMNRHIIYITTYYINNMSINIFYITIYYINNMSINIFNYLILNLI